MLSELILTGLAFVQTTSFSAAPWYVTGTVFGSLFGAKLSMKIEQLLGAST